MEKAEPAPNENWPDPDEALYHCQRAGCPATAPKHRWSDGTKAGKGWFHKRNGDSWCPEHIPEWVDQWRANRGG